MESVNDGIPRLEKIEDISEDDLKEECNICRGRKIVPVEKLILKSPCKACGGAGKLYWVDRAMKKSSSSTENNIATICARDNVTFLMQLIRDIGYSIGCEIQIDIRQINYLDHTHSMYHTVRSLDGKLYDIGGP